VYSSPHCTQRCGGSRRKNDQAGSSSVFLRRGLLCATHNCFNVYQYVASTTFRKVCMYAAPTSPPQVAWPFSSTHTSYALSVIPPLTTRRPQNGIHLRCRVPSKSQQVLVSMVDAAASKSVSTSGRGGTGRGVGGGRGTAGIRIMVTTRDVSKLISSLRKVVKPLKVRRT